MTQCQLYWFVCELVLRLEWNPSYTVQVCTAAWKVLWCLINEECFSHENISIGSEIA